ncbi:MAG: sulfite exporter TauE/SafE family protein [Planctomycetota bacterium]
MGEAVATLSDPQAWLVVAAIGLAAGLLGGLLGVGGSTIVIPGLTIFLGPDQHLYQASAMWVNLVVAAAAIRAHRKAGVYRKRVLLWMGGAACVCILGGVALSNLPVFTRDGGARTLAKVFAVFQVYVAIVNAKKLARELHAARQRRKTQRAGGQAAEPEAAEPRLARWRCASTGSAMGVVAGMLGIGGGAVAVPLQQVVMRLPLRACIAHSAAVMTVSALVGATAKSLTLPSATQGRYDIGDALWLALLVSLGAVGAARVGAALTHRLPVPWVRGVFLVVLLWAAWKMWTL